MKVDGRKGWAKSSATNILRVAIVLFFLGLAIWAITLNRYELVIADHEPWLWLTTALVSVGPELAGIVIGVVTIDYLNERRQDEQLKRQLILQLGSTHNDVTDTALRALRGRGWLYNGSLSGAYLEGTNLSGADLSEADLSEANLRNADLSEADLKFAILSGANSNGANFSGADLRWARLKKASLFSADLRGAYLEFSKLSEANLRNADLSKAYLSCADLSGTNLSGANLVEADLHRANLSRSDLWRANLSGARSFTIKQLEQAERLGGAIMPDGTQLDWDATRNIEGPTFEEWQAQYPPPEPDYMAGAQAESNSPEPS